MVRVSFEFRGNKRNSFFETRRRLAIRTVNHAYRKLLPTQALVKTGETRHQHRLAKDWLSGILEHFLEKNERMRIPWRFACEAQYRFDAGAGVKPVLHRKWAVSITASSTVSCRVAYPLKSELVWISQSRMTRLPQQSCESRGAPSRQKTPISDERVVWYKFWLAHVIITPRIRRTRNVIDLVDCIPAQARVI